MNDRLAQLEAIARRLDPEPAQRAEWRRAIEAHVEAFIRGVPDAPAYVPDYAPRERGGASLFREEPARIDDLLDTISREIERDGVNETSPRFFGYVPGGGIYASALGDYLGSVINRYVGVYFAAPGAVRLEHRIVEWLAGLVGYPPDRSGGDLTSGGSIANLSAIVAAREAHGIKSSDVARSVVYMTSYAHHSVHKALRIAGLADCVQRTVATDACGRMDAGDLARCIAAHRQAGLEPWMVVASAGTTDLGAVDPLPQIAAVCEEHGLWMHVDAAYGGAFLLCEPGRRALAGIEHSDSSVIDPHKGLFLPFGSGALVVRNRDHLVAANTYTAGYMQDTRQGDVELSPADLSPELTRPFRGLRLWLPLQLSGLAPFRAALEEKLLLARYFHERMSGIRGFEVGPPPDLSIVTYRYVPRAGDADEFNRRLVDAVQREGRIFVSSTQVNGRVTLRLAVLQFRTHLEHVDLALERLEHHARSLEA